MPPKKKKETVLKEDAGAMTNYYEVMPKKFILDTHNPNKKIHGINVPFRILIVGGSGAGKTQTLLNLIKVMNGTFQNIHIITKNKDEPLYNYIQEKLGKEGLTISEGVASAPDLDAFNKKEQSLIVMDDLVLEKNQKTLEQYFIRARKLNCSLVYISQSYYGVPKMIRQNLNYLIIKRLNTIQDLFRIMREYSLGIDKATLQDIYEDAVNENKQDFLLVDIDAEPQERFRKNWKAIEL